MKKNIVDIKTQREQVAAKSQEMQNTVTTTPGWLVRYGLSVFFITLIAIAGFGMIIRFPERISAPASITSENGLPAVRIFIDEKDTAHIRDGQNAVITIKDSPAGNPQKFEGKTGNISYSVEDKKYFVPVLIASANLPGINDKWSADAQITYGERTLLQRILQKEK
ncbi:MAG: hypothetical protein EOO01_36765 [Chitinophagaceae bacterium]|nr:MAG: hypothetical protein EOO01_36765 [Chitinophagaceae bacterium]